MNNPTIAQIIAQNHSNDAKAVIVDEVSDSLMYIGYCTDSCEGYDDEKWRIERIRKVDGVQTIFLAGGTSAFCHKWSERTNLTYAPNQNWK